MVAVAPIATGLGNVVPTTMKIETEMQLEYQLLGDRCERHLGLGIRINGGFYIKISIKVDFVAK